MKDWSNGLTTVERLKVWDGFLAGLQAHEICFQINQSRLKRKKPLVCEAAIESWVDVISNYQGRRRVS